MSCATSVTFNVEHPPVVDLRGVNSITIIPFEKNSSAKYESLSAYVTSVLTAGIKDGVIRGNINFIEPLALENVPQRNLWQYVDVFITGRVNNINHDVTSSRTTTRNFWNEAVVVVSATFIVTVDIEYSYIRAKDNRTLATFRKSETIIKVVEYERTHDTFDNWNRRGHGHYPEWYDPGQSNWSGRRRGHSTNDFSQWGSWGEYLAKSVIDRFSSAMNREHSPWITTEKRNLRVIRGNDPGNVFIAYNDAILLAADEQYAKALVLLENVRKELLESGKNIPRFLRKEIEKMTDFANGYKILEEYRRDRLGFQMGANAVVSLSPLSSSGLNNVELNNTREIKGSVNLSYATVYALSDSIADAEDASVWSKILASAEVNAAEGQWSMRVSSTAPSFLWFVIMDSRSDLHITQSALDTSEMVVLDTARMIKLDSKW